MVTSDAYEKSLQTEAALQAIETEVKATQPLTSELQPVDSLRSSYEANSNFDRGVVYLSSEYKNLRQVRGDGNCYYRAFLYSLCEHLCKCTEKQELDRVRELVKNSMDQVTKHGYDRFTIEMFHEELVELLDTLDKQSHEELHAKLNEENATSDYCTWYMRVMTAAHLKSDPDRFLGFLEGDHVDIVTFCKREVEPMNRECTMVQVLALAEAMGVAVSIEYLDGHDFKDKLAKHDFGPTESNTATRVTLLYRPGHYDILYK